MTVLGLDSCKGGWVVVAANDEGVIDIGIAPDVGTAVDRGRERWGASTVVIDIPIGLPDSSTRATERAARERLGPLRSSVFDVPIRESVHAPTRLEADRISRARAGRGVGAQSFALSPKIIEVDTYVRELMPSDIDVREGHPEVSFAQLHGGPLDASKKTLKGALLRHSLLARAGLSVPLDAELTLKGTGFDDVFDAAVMAWTALRIASGDAAAIVDPPEHFSDGIECSMWV
ncbi:DUF429 domain-containing protein [Demequina sediminicola]|uniref:DUF429 domain-containing protein n=1 Tax=Demequina sediminicola TaxID=1095026 RepID=UPI000784962B|nr:DUF429 domain-containing protein [Demequina sediminicola]